MSILLLHPVNNLTIALDLEGTLIQDQLDPRPRPGLYKFLELLRILEMRICIMTTVPEPIFRKIVTSLIGQGAAPDWFAEAEYINWDRPCKNLNCIIGSALKNCFLVDDYEGYVCPHQKDRWICIETYFEQEDDEELTRVAKVILGKSSFDVPSLATSATTDDILFAVKESRKYQDRAPGGYKDQIKIDNDFDKTPDKVIATFEGEAEVLAETLIKNTENNLRQIDEVVEKLDTTHEDFKGKRESS